MMSVPTIWKKTQANKLVAYCMRAKGYTVMTGYR